MPVDNTTGGPTSGGAGRAEDPIVLSGCGWVTPCGTGTIADVLAACARPAALDAGAFWAVPDSGAGEAGSTPEGYGPFPAEIQRDKAAWMSATAIQFAARQADLSLPGVTDGEAGSGSGSRRPPAAERVGLVVGCGLAGHAGMMDFATEVRQQSARFVSPIHFPQTVGNYPAGALSRALDFRGPNVTVACGLASGLEAIVEACSLIAAGEADLVFAGGVDFLSPALATGLAAPGVILSEGACFFAVERRAATEGRGRQPLAVVTPSCHLHGTDGRFKESAGGNVARAQTRGPSIVSVAGCLRADAVLIESWIGRCLGAAGASAVAAAIGALRGLAVPVLQSARTPGEAAQGDAVIAPKVFDPPPADQEVVALVMAGEYDQNEPRLELTLPRAR